MAGVEQKGKKKSPVIDMTAMVDVAFLLLTFFILTTTLANHSVLEVNKPYNGGDPAPIACSKMLVLYPDKDDQIIYQFGCEAFGTVKNGQELRQLIAQQKAAVNDPIISIKPLETAVFSNLVDVLDEMNISKVSKYALGAVTDEDKELLKSKGLI